MFTLLRNNISQQIFVDGSHPAPLYPVYSEEGLEGRCFFYAIFESMNSVSLHPPIWFPTRIRISDVNAKRVELECDNIRKETKQKRAVPGSI